MGDWSIGTPPPAGATTLSQVTAPAQNDRIPVLDVSDTSTSPANAGGSDKWMTAAQAGALSSPDIPRVMFFGTSNVSGNHTVEGGERWTDKVCAALHAEQVNYGVGGAVLAQEQTGSGPGGYAQVWNALTPRVASSGTYTVRNSSPYLPFSPVVMFDYGYNDITYLSATLSTSLAWWAMATQAVCCIARAGGWFPDTDGSVAYSGGWTAYTNQQNYGWPTSHGTFSTGQTVTITVPADFPGGEVDILTVAYSGGTKWSTVVDGGSAQVLDGTGSAFGSASGHNNIVVQRLTGLAAGSHTIVVTVSAIDGGGAEAIFGGWLIAAPETPLVVLVNSPLSPDLPAASGGAHTPITVSDLNTLNADMVTVASGFSDGRVVVADIAGALTAAGCNVTHTAPLSGYASDDSHLNARGHGVAANAVLAAIRSAPVPGLGRVTAMDIVMRQINGPLEPALASGWSVTGGSAAWFGMDRSGNTVLRFQLTKNVAGVFGETIFTLPPGYAPDSYTIAAAMAWGSGFTSALPALVSIDSGGHVGWIYGDPTVDLQVSWMYPANAPGF